jgi:hypothetical protein
MKDRLKPYVAIEYYAVLATRFLLIIRGVKQKDLYLAMGAYSSTTSALLNCKLNWNVNYLTVVCELFRITPDEFFRLGRILHQGLPEYPAPEELAGTKAGSLARFGRLYDRASLGTWLPQVHSAEQAAAWSPAAFAAYEKGKLSDAAMYAALCDMVARLQVEPAMSPDQIEKSFGLLRD